MGRIIVFAIFVFTGFFLAGCASSQLDFSLKKDMAQPEGRHDVLDMVVGVDDFIDFRPQVHGNENTKWKGFIPGILWLEINSEIPEIYSAYSSYDSRPFNTNVSESVADALKKSGLFKNVIYLPFDPYKNPDYRLEGILRRSFVGERAYYYGSGMYVWLARILGLPFVSYHMELEVDLRLRSMASNTIVWEGKIIGERDDKYNNVYSVSKGKDGKHIFSYNFSRILYERLPELLPEMHRAVCH